MPSQGANRLGIDFGTTNSVAAIATPAGEANGILAPDGRPHPSVVWYRPDHPPTVGRDARERVNQFAQQAGNLFVPSVKRHLGTDRSFTHLGRELSAIHVASDILSHVLTDLRQRVGYDGPPEAVMTVPVRTHGLYRAHLRAAAERAGLHVRTFVHEPFAAVVGYYYGQHEQAGIRDRDGSRILVFDWGGGTLDITVTEIRGDTIFELATNGLGDVAGDDFDRALSDAIRSRLVGRGTLRHEEADLHGGTKDRFLVRCETAKIALSDDDKTTVEIGNAFPRARGGPLDVSEDFTRPEFEHLITRWVDEAMAAVSKALDDAGLRDEQISTVLMIGGSSRVPLVRQRLTERFGKRTAVVDDADTIIAKGAAIIHSLGMVPVLAHAVSVRLSDGRLYEIFKEGMVADPDLCRRGVQFFCTDPRDGQAKLVVVRKMGSREQLLCPVPIAVERPPADSRSVRPERVTCHFQLDSNLILQIQGWGATQGAAGAATESVLDLRFGLKVSA